MNKPKATRFMTKLFSGDEASTAAIADKVAEAKEKGTASDDEFNYGKVGDDIMVKDKTNGEVSQVSEGDDAYKVDPVLSAEDETKTQSEQSDLNAAEKKAEDKAPQNDLKGQTSAEAAPKLTEEISESKPNVDKIMSKEDGAGKTKKFTDGSAMTSDQKLDAVFSACKAMCDKMGMKWDEKTMSFSTPEEKKLESVVNAPDPKADKTAVQKTEEEKAKSMSTVDQKTNSDEASAAKNPALTDAAKVNSDSEDDGVTVEDKSQEPSEEDKDFSMHFGDESKLFSEKTVAAHSEDFLTNMYGSK